MNGQGSLSVAIAACPEDLSLALRLMKWIDSLGCCRERHAVLFVEKAHIGKMRELPILAKKAFGRVELIQTAPCALGYRWPHPGNWAFTNAIRYRWKNAFLWLEPDSLPVRSGWLDSLEEEYIASGKAFMGTVIEWQRNGKPDKMLNGVAIYPKNSSQILGRSMASSPHLSWDIACAPLMVPMAHNSEQFQHYLKSPTGAVVLRDLAVVKSKTTLFHGDKFGGLLRALMVRKAVKQMVPETIQVECKVENPAKAESNPSLTKTVVSATGCHSGDRGDVVYSLAVCRELGIRNLVLYPADYTRVRMSPESAAGIIPLVMAQPYMETCVYADAEPDMTFHLDGFRQLLGKPDGRFLGHNLSALHLRNAHLAEGVESEQWLWAVPIKPPKPVIIARTARYHSNNLDWRRVMTYYAGRCIFVGETNEYQNFVSEFGEVPYLPTPDLLVLAQYIAGSDLFIGNQSCHYAIAEGLKHNAILEWVAGPSQNCHFSRRGLCYGTESLELPDIQERPVFDWNVITDAHSGLGRVALEYYRNVRKVGLRWVPTRRTVEFTNFDSSIAMHETRSGGPCVMMEAVPFIREYAHPGDVICSMWESTRLPKSAMRAINAGPAGIVPSEWCRNLYRESGVTVPLFKVPLGVDSSQFKPDPQFVSGEVLTFGAAGRFCGDGNPRKNLDKVIAGFLAAFPTQRDVNLIIKGYDSPRIVKCSDARVHVVCDFWPQSRLISWYQNLDVFINLAAGGGWELHLHEAMACGAVPVSLDWSSSLEFVDGLCGYLVKPDLIGANWGVYDGLGQWALPNMDSYIATLRHIYEHRGELARRRNLARNAVEHLTWDNAAKVLENILLKLA